MDGLNTVIALIYKINIYNMTKKEAKKKLDKLDKEREALLEIINKPESLFDTKKFSDVCEKLDEEELTLDNFDSDKEYALWQIGILQKFYNGDWKVEPKNPDQRKWYPWYRITGSGLVFVGSSYFGVSFLGRVAYYKDKETSDFVGTTYISIYQRLL